MQQALAWKITSLFLFGIVTGLLLLRFMGPDTSEVANSEPTELRESQDERIDIPVPTGTPVSFSDSDRSASAMHAGDLLREGDKYLRAGNPLMALENYEGFESHSERQDSSILLRQAICFENSRQYPLALRTYRLAIKRRHSYNHVLLAATGIARIHVGQGRTEEAIDVLADHLLQVDRSDSVPLQTHATLSYLWAKLLEAHVDHQDQKSWSQNTSDTETASPKSGADLLHPLSIAVAGIKSDPERLLQLIDFPVEETLSSGFDNEHLDIRVLQAPTKQAETISLAISSSLQPINLLLSQIAAQCEVDAQISQRAQAALTGRSTRAELKSVTLSVFLDQLLIPFGLAWQQSPEGVIYIADSNEFPPQQRLSFRFDTAARAFRRFEFDYPDDPARKPSLLSRGGLAMRRGEFDQASNLFQELDQSSPEGETQARLFFNLGKLSLLLNRKPDANQYFYRAVDQTLDADIKSSGYCLLSGLHLSDIELEPAVTTARRGLRLAVTKQQKQLGALNLARAYLLKFEPINANDVLFENQEYLEGDAAKTEAAAVLGAYARMIATSDERANFKEQKRLLRAVTMLKTDQLLSFSDPYVAAMAYNQFGLRDRSINMLLLALSQPDVGRWQRKILFELAGQQSQADRPQDAVRTYQLLLVENDTWRTKSLMKLAELYAENNQNDSCIEACRQLWREELNADQKVAVLNMLGRAFERQGEHHHAAICFAGMLPDSF